MKFRLFILLFFPVMVSAILVQKSKEVTSRSALLEMDLPEEAIRDNGIFSKAAAKSVLELEANSDQITISEVEVLIFQSEDKVASDRFLEDFKSSLQKDNQELIPSTRNISYSWIANTGSVFLIYFNASKKESDIYIGKASRLPDYLNNSKIIASSQPDNHNTRESLGPAPVQEMEQLKVETSMIKTGENLSMELVGNWGTLTGAKVNWRDESTGNLLISGVSKGFGLELKSDGSFVQSTVVTSGRPSYRVFVSTFGSWQASNDKIMFYPKDRHYRKWENEIIMVDEHSVPENYFAYWRKTKNELTGKICLFVRYAEINDEQELCQE